MDFGLSQPQQLLRQSVRAHLERNVDVERVRQVMESDSGHDPAIHRELGEQGVCGLLIAEQHGGSGLDLLDLTVAAQELGHAACPANFHSTYVHAALLLQHGGSDEQRAAWLPRIADGDAIVAVVPDAPVDASGGTPIARGTATFVADAPFADAFLLEHGDAVYLTPAGSTGITVHALETVDDTRRLGDVDFDGVVLERLPGADAAVCRRALQAAQIALAADALGAARKSIDIAVDYAKQRQQFGRVIGSYQAVKHLCAETFAEVEPVQSLLWHAAHCWDQQSPSADELAPLCKAHATETATMAVTNMTQVFGGIGFTWECDMHVWYKRAGYDRQVLGGPEALRAQAFAATA